MAKAFINPRGLFEPSGWTHVVTTDSSNLVFVAGQVAMDEKGNVVGKDNFSEQAQQTFLNLKTALESVGASPKDMVQMRYYVKDFRPKYLPIIREARREILSLEKSPASTLVGVPALFHDDLLIEIEAIGVME